MNWRKTYNAAFNLLLVFLCLQLLGSGSQRPDDPIEHIRQYTRFHEFEYVSWTLNALATKFSQFSLNLAAYLDLETQRKVVYDYLDLVQTIQVAEAELNTVYAAPNIQDKETAALPLRQRLDGYYQQRSQLGPLAESILQDMLGAVLAEEGFTFGGQPIPPVLYRSTPLPWGLIVSPRDVIQQDAHISLLPELTIEDHIALEDQISQNLDVSTLVVPLGGLGTYPTMIAQTTNLNWIVEVVAHEWIHNYLNLRPLGLLYSSNPQLRTINETAASIFGNEIGAKLIETYFPERVPPPPPSPPDPSQNAPPPPFDFRAEMFETRVQAEALLAEGNIEQAEAYMEARRLFFWENGYRIRKLNQAYFAFYGAYADVPGGAAGVDPVGEAVRQLRAQSPTLKDFIDDLAWLTDFKQLETKLETP